MRIQGDLRDALAWFYNLLNWFPYPWYRAQASTGKRPWLSLYFEIEETLQCQTYTGYAKSTIFR
jgi:hypothetical protein